MQRPSRPACIVLVCVTAFGGTLPTLVSAQLPPSSTNNHYTQLSQTHVLGSAESMMQAGELDAAETAFRQAFESIRAERGLFHEAQLPVLGKLLTANLARQDWEQFNYFLNYHGALTGRLYQRQPVKYAEALETGADWHQRAALVMNDEHRTWHLIRARNLIWQAVSALEQTSGNQARLSPLLYHIAVLHYYLTTEASLRGLTSLEMRTNQPVRVSGWSMSGNETTRRSYQVGQELLERIRRLHASADSDNHTLARIDTLLGDWQLLFGRQALAREYYLKVYQELRADPSGTPVLEQLFGAAVSLPAPFLLSGPTRVDDLRHSLARPGNDTELLSVMNSSLTLFRPQLTDDFFKEDHQHEFHQAEQ